MSDLISRQEVIEELQQAKIYDGEYHGFNYGIDYAIAEIKCNIPSAEKVGEWIKLGDCEYRCSECGKIIFADDENERYYCPSCGSHNLKR